MAAFDLIVPWVNSLSTHPPTTTLRDSSYSSLQYFPYWVWYLSASVFDLFPYFGGALVSGVYLLILFHQVLSRFLVVWLSIKF